MGCDPWVLHGLQPASSDMRVSRVRRQAEGRGSSILPDSGSCGPPSPLTVILESGRTRERPPLAKMAQGKVFTLSIPEVRKMDGWRGLEHSKSS